MSLLRRLAGGNSESRNDVPWAGWPPYPLNSQQPSAATFAGVAVNADSAMRHAAVWACVRLISGTIGQMPLQAVSDAAAFPEVVSPTPQLLASPSALVPRSAWVESVLVALLLRGNCYGRVVEWSSMGRPTRIDLLNPDRVRPDWDKASGQKVFWLHGDDGSSVPHYAWETGRGDIWHVPGLLLPGSWVGLSPIEYAKQTIGQGLAAEKFGSQWFGEGGVPAAILSTDQPVTEEQASTIKSRFMTAVRGRREPAVLGAGLKYEAIQVAPEESQFIEAQSWSTAQVARVFGLSPSLLEVSTGSSNALSYQNRESRVSDFMAFGLGPWIHRLEESLTTLLPDAEHARFKTGAVLRADIQTRYQSYLTAAQIEQATGSPLLTANEMRSLENLPPLDESNVVDTTARVNAVGVLVRSGFDPHDALKLLGLPDLGYSDVYPVTVIPADAVGGPNGGTQG